MNRVKLKRGKIFGCMKEASNNEQPTIYEPRW